MNLQIKSISKNKEGNIYTITNCKDIQCKAVCISDCCHVDSIIFVPKQKKQWQSARISEGSNIELFKNMYIPQKKILPLSAYSSNIKFHKPLIATGRFSSICYWLLPLSEKDFGS